MGRVKQIWCLSPMREAKVQASLRIRAVSPEPLLLAHTSNESRGTFRQKTRALAPLNGWACAVKICHDGMLEDTNSLDTPQILLKPDDWAPVAASICLTLSPPPAINLLNLTLFLAHQIRKSEVFAWDRNSYLTHVISPQKDIVHLNSVCTGCIGHLVTLSLGWCVSDVRVTCFWRQSNVSWKKNVLRQRHCMW